MSAKPESGLYSHSLNYPQTDAVSSMSFGAPLSPKIRELMQRYETQRALIASNISNSVQSSSAWEGDIKNCKTKVVGDSDFVECLMDGYSCPWTQYFGNMRYCKFKTKNI